jgi:hypothetical protein
MREKRLGSNTQKMKIMVCKKGGRMGQFQRTGEEFKLPGVAGATYDNQS